MRVTKHSSVLVLSVFLAGAVWLAACAGATPQANAPSPDSAAAQSDEDDEDDEGEGGADADDGGDEGGAEPGDEAKAEVVEPPAPAPRRGSGRPAIQYGPKKKIESTFGSTPASVLKLKAKGGNVVLKIPEFALYTGTNITWQIARPGSPMRRPLVGSVCELIPTIGGKTKPERVKADEGKFQLRWPMGRHASVNLAVGVATGKMKFGRQKYDWKIYAPTRVDSGLKEAYFELDAIDPSYLHATTAPATEGEGK